MHGCSTSWSYVNTRIIRFEPQWKYLWRLLPEDTGDFLLPDTVKGPPRLQDIDPKPLPLYDLRTEIDDHSPKRGLVDNSIKVRVAEDAATLTDKLDDHVKSAWDTCEQPTVGDHISLEFILDIMTQRRYIAKMGRGRDEDGLRMSLLPRGEPWLVDHPDEIRRVFTGVGLVSGANLLSAEEVALVRRYWHGAI